VSVIEIGDCVIELGPESAAPGAKVAVESKENAAYDLAKAREEIDTARKNRDAMVGLFVFSKRTAPAGIEPLARFGHDVFVVWDQDNAASDLYLRIGMTLARALCVRGSTQQASHAADFTAIDAAILEIDKRLKDFDQMKTWTETIRNNSDNIIKKLEIVRKSLETQVALLTEKTNDVKSLFAKADEYKRRPIPFVMSLREQHASTRSPMKLSCLGSP
jgi:hypothetical protein